MENAEVEGRRKTVREEHEDPQMLLRLFPKDSLETLYSSRLCQSLIKLF